jgi:K+-sensing histidine kinase KdpD
MSDHEQHVETIERRVSYLIHDVEPALVSCKSLLRLIERGAYNPESATHQRLVRSSQNALLFAEKLLQQLLETTRLRQGRYQIQEEELDSLSVIEEGISTASILAREKSITIETSCPQGLFYFRSDGALLARMIQNLVINAVKNVPEDSTIFVSTAWASPHLLVRVQDQGPGLPNDVLEQIFEEHAQWNLRDRKSYSGVGLGLSYCLEGSRALGGSIHAENCSPHGLRFTIMIPVQLI